MSHKRWFESRLLALDLETTHPEPDEARIVQYAVAWVGGTYATSQQETIVNPGVPIPDEAAAVHGITTEAARQSGQRPEVAVTWLVDVLKVATGQGMPIVGHNIGGYDLTVLDREVRRHVNEGGLEAAVGGPVGPVIDTLVLSKHVDPYRRRVSPEQGAHVLKTCVQALIPTAWGVAWSDEDAHGALYDALMAGRVAIAIARSYGEVGGTDAAELHRRQTDWAAGQAASLQEYLRSEKAGPKQDPQAVVSGAWPITPPPEAPADRQKETHP